MRFRENVAFEIWKSSFFVVNQFLSFAVVIIDLAEKKNAGKLIFLKKKKNYELCFDSCH